MWIVLGIAYSLDWISGSLLNIYFLITLVIAYGRAKEINALYATVNKMESIFNRYSKLMQCVEEDNFQSEELKEISGQLANEKELASHAIKRLSSYIGGLDNDSVWRVSFSISSTCGIHAMPSFWNAGFRLTPINFRFGSTRWLVSTR